MNRMVMVGGLAGLLTGCGIFEPRFQVYEESEPLGATVTKVEGETYIEHSGQGIGRTSYSVDSCNVTVKYEDDYVKTYEESIEPVYCYKLQPGDWLEGWTVKRYRKTIETGEVELINMTRHITLAEEISKRLNE